MATTTDVETSTQRLPLSSDDPNADRLNELRRLFPEAFTEGKVDLDRLGRALGESVDRTRTAAVWSTGAVDAKQTILDEYQKVHDQHSGDLIQIERRLREFIRQNSAILSPLTHYNRIDEFGPYTGSRKVHNPRPGGYNYDVVHPSTGKACIPPANGYRFPFETMNRLLKEGRILFGQDENQIIQIKEYLKDYNGKLSSVIHLDSRAGSNELEAVFEQRKVFDNPKPVSLLREIFGFVLEEDDLMLDFFAGSGSSGQAVLELNQLDGGNRTFLLVQFPERVNEDAPATRLGLATISDICIDRIRRYSTPDPPGLKVLALSSSNFRIWSADEAPREEGALGEELQLYADHLLTDRSTEDVLYELLLKSGFPLTAAIEQSPVGDGTVYIVEDGELAICLEDPVTQGTLDEVASMKPRRLLCLDRAFHGNDALKTNAVLQMRDHAIEFRTV